MIETERREAVAVVRMAAPPLNLVSSKMIEALGNAFAGLAADPPRCAVLFCSGGGADVREMAELDATTARAFITRLHEACVSIRDLDAPVIAAIDGPCLGAHLEVAAACDMRVASTRSLFGMPEIKVGLPSVIDAYWIALLCGLGNASALVFEGEMIPAAEAHRIGLVNRIAPDGALEKEALEWATSIARHSPVALAEQKRVLRDWTDAPYREAARASVERFVETISAGQAAEAMRAMLEKRSPRY